MQTEIVTIPTDRIFDWDSFHTVFKEALGFPDFYGRNMNAWIDCLGYADSEEGMIATQVGPNCLLTLRLDNAADFEKRCPEQFKAMVECAAFVNFRRLEVGDEPLLALLLGGRFEN